MSGKIIELTNHNTGTKFLVDLTWFIIQRPSLVRQAMSGANDPIARQTTLLCVFNPMVTIPIRESYELVKSIICPTAESAESNEEIKS